MLVALTSVALLLAVAECYLRFSGYKLPAFKQDGIAGWSNRSGSFRSEENPDVYENCWDNGQRIRRPDRDKQGKHRIAVFGCS